jgi:hypothetical protein
MSNPLQQGSTDVQICTYSGKSQTMNKWKAECRCLPLVHMALWGIRYTWTPKVQLVSTARNTSSRRVEQSPRLRSTCSNPNSGTCCQSLFLRYPIKKRASSMTSDPTPFRQRIPELFLSHIRTKNNIIFHPLLSLDTFRSADLSSADQGKQSRVASTPVVPSAHRSRPLACAAAPRLVVGMSEMPPKAFAIRCQMQVLRIRSTSRRPAEISPTRKY